MHSGPQAWQGRNQNTQNLDPHLLPFSSLPGRGCQTSRESAWYSPQLSNIWFMDSAVSFIAQMCVFMCGLLASVENVL